MSSQKNAPVRGAEWTMLQAVARPLAMLFALGVALKNGLYDHGLLRPQRLAWPVVSVGNLSVGGTGKTPFVRELARLLQQRGWQVDVLSRGHGRNSKQVEAVDPAGPVQRYGDEPLLLARSGLNVYVGRKRYGAGRLAEVARLTETSDAAFGLTARSLHLLDDGFQHRRLARAVEIVLLERRDFTDRMLPAGRLREPCSALRRADICVLREEDRDLAAPVMEAMQTGDPARVWFLRRVTSMTSAGTGPEAGRLQRAVAFCGIGNAAQFFSSLRQAGVTLVAEVAFRDHHVYTDRDVDALVERVRACHADGFVTTEKDSVRLEGGLRETLGAFAPLHIADLAVTLEGPERCLDFLVGLLDKRPGVR
ncbi:MAG: tetraacyldisaccharide 4'-kinase [Acidobacteriaceae bacterium]